MKRTEELIKKLKEYVDDIKDGVRDYISPYVLTEAADTIETLSAKVRKENGFIFPENATNGDVLKRLLYGKAIITEFIHDVNISVNNKVIGQFDMEWWNSPYKRGETE